MKKILTILLLCLIAIPAAVFAQDEPIYLNWESTLTLSGAEELVSKGDFITLEDPAVKMWMPSHLKPYELPEDLIEKGFIGYYSDEQNNSSVTIIFMEAEGETLDSWKKELAAHGDVSNITDVVVNGVPAVGYDLEDKDTSCMTFISDDGSVLEFSFFPMSDKEFSAETFIILSSIQKTDKESLTSINWEESRTALDEAGIPGKFVTFDQIGVKVWIPSTYEKIELDEKDIADGFIGCYIALFEEWTIDFGSIMVSCLDMNVSSMVEYAGFLHELGYDNAELVNLNGREAAMYYVFDEEYDFAAAALILESGKILEVSVHPVSDDVFLNLARTILSSVQLSDGSVQPVFADTGLRTYL